MLKKYRTLKRRYYDVDEVEKKISDFDQKYVNPGTKPWMTTCEVCSDWPLGAMTFSRWTLIRKTLRRISNRDLTMTVIMMSFWSVLLCRTPFCQLLICWSKVECNPAECYFVGDILICIIHAYLQNTCLHAVCMLTCSMHAYMNNAYSHAVCMLTWIMHTHMQYACEYAVWMCRWNVHAYM